MALKVKSQKFRGQDRRLAEQALRDLVQLARHDERIAKLSPASRRSRIPFIDPTDHVLGDAYTTLQLRLQHLLALK